MSWLFSQALVAEYLPATCSDGAQYAQLNVMPTPHKFWRNDKMMEFSRLSQFGLTLQLLTENSPMLVSRGLTRVISDLTKMGYDEHWARLSASNFGAPHQRDRIWIVAHTQSRRFNTERLSIREKSQKPLSGINCEDVGNTKSTEREQTWTNQCRSEKWTSRTSQELSYTTSIRLQGQGKSWFACDPAENPERETDRTFYECVGHIWGIKSRLGRVANGVAHRVDRLKAIGNGQVPEVARSAFEFLRGDES